MALPVKIASYFGVLEYRSIGVLEKGKTRNSVGNSPFIAPLLHHSITPADYRTKERRQKPPLVVAQSRVLPRTAG